MNRVRSYDAETGEIVWETAGLTMNPIPSPVAGDGMVFATSGFRGNSLKAIRLADAKDDITGTPAVAWTFDRDTPILFFSGSHPKVQQEALSCGAQGFVLKPDLDALRTEIQEAAAKFLADPNVTLPLSSAGVPSATSCFSTTFCVEMPAWS